MSRSTFNFLLLITSDAFALNILGIVGIPYKSHYMAFKQLFRELAKRGHSVTVMNHFPDEEPLPNLRFVDLQGNTTPNVKSLQKHEERTASLEHLYNFYYQITQSPETVIAECEILFSSASAKVHLEEAVKYDVVFVEQFASDCGLVYAATLFDAPIIGITSHVVLPWAYQRLGIPFDPAADPFYFSDSLPNPSLLLKVESAVGHLLFNTIGRWNIQRNIYKIFAHHLPNVSFDIERLAKLRMKMVFAYQHYSITGARLTPPQLLEIAGAHIITPKPVSKDIEEFLSGAEHGAIYVSFGSNLKASTMSPQKMQEFLAAFSRIPQKVLWKWENDTFPTGHDHILTRKWFPQLDVLCHPKVLAFVSHGGMLSLSEAAHCAKPLLTVPFFGDQFSNAAAVRASGLGLTVYFQHLTADTLTGAIEELTSAEMQQSAQRVSKLWHDRPLPVLDSAIYWTEYVARHHAAPPSLPSKHNTWFEAQLLDVYTVLFAILLLLSWICYLIYKLIKLIICRILGRLICGRKVKSQ